MASIRKRTWANAAGEERTRWQVDYIDQDGKRRHKQFTTKKAADGFMVGAQLRSRARDAHAAERQDHGRPRRGALA